MISRFKEFYLKYERHISSGAFIFGFVWDFLTLKRIDLWLENLIFLVYLAVAAASIALVNLYESGRLRLKFLEDYREFLSLPIQFAFGGLFSGFFIFYTRSATLAGSWPFLLFLVFILIGNEFFRNRYLRLTFRLSIFFVALFSYLIFAVPVLVGKIGAGVFILSGAVSLIVFWIIFYLLSFTDRENFLRLRRLIFLSVLVIFLVFNYFYFINAIPPLPLALKEIGIYHSVARTADGYSFEFEKPPWYLFFQDSGTVFHWVYGRPVYVFSSVFAPTDLNTKILHEWSRFDEEKNEWVVTDRLPFAITGGRDEGYRGFSFKRSVEPGRWRVDVMTERGQLLGRRNFDIVEVSSLPELASSEK